MQPPPVDEFVRQFMKLLPDDLQAMKSDVEKNVRAALSATFARMDLVTREEFDIQSALLARTRELVNALEKKVGELEQQLETDSPAGKK